MDLSQAYDAMLGDLAGAFPLVLLAVAGLVIVVWDAFRNNDPLLPYIAGGALAIGLVFEGSQLASEQTTLFYGNIRAGGFAAFINMVLLGGTLLSVVLSVPYLRQIKHAYGEVYALMLFATVGMMALATGNSLIMLFVGLETMSVCLYILVGLVRKDEGSIESAFKYFVLGAFATGFFLYGIALLYGATGTVYLHEMQSGFAQSGATTMFWAGVGLLLVGFFFKVSAVPFHMWTPDAYQGAPTTLTGYMSTTSKAAAFTALILVLYYALPPERWTTVLAVVAVLTMVAGNVLALAQDNVKRMLAYSSIAHGGYILVGLAAGTAAGYSGALYYLLIYSIMNIGAFGVIALLEWDGKIGREQTMESLSGIGTQRPFLGLAMAVFMFSLIGFPPFGGFFGKVAVFGPAIDAGLTWLAVIGLLASVASAGYYLRVVYVFSFKSADERPAEAPATGTGFNVPFSSLAVLSLCVVLLVVVGFIPGLRDVTTHYFIDMAVAAGTL